MKKRNSTELKRRMEGRWLSALSALAPSLDEAVNKIGSNVSCPVEGWPEAFRLFNDVNFTGGGVRHSLRVFPEGIDLLMWVNDWSFPKVFDELVAWLGDKPVEVGPRYLSKPILKPKAVNETGMRKWLNQIWKEALPFNELGAYPARAYFGYRLVRDAALASSNMRFHPCLNYKDKEGNLLGKFGAVLSLVCNNDGEPIAIHRTFITKGGLKVDLGSAHKSKTNTPPVHKRVKGRHIHLFAPQNGYLGVSEGIETALAVFEAKGFPVWPTLSNTNLHSFKAPKGVHTILNFVDKDRSKAGENSAKTLRTNMEVMGIRVIDLLPPTPILNSDEKGVDWADQLKRDRSGFDLIDQTLHFDQLKKA